MAAFVLQTLRNRAFGRSSDTKRRTSGSRSDVRQASQQESAILPPVLLAKDLTGYHNLVQLASRTFTEGFHHKPRIDMELLQEFSEGLIALSGGRDGSLNHFLRQGDRERALANANEFTALFGKDNFFIEIQDHWSADEPQMNEQLAGLATECGFGLVATNNAHYLTTEDSVARQILLCIADGRTLTESEKANAVDGKRYVRSAEEMWEIFGNTYPEALTNTTKIAEMCQLDLAVGGDNLFLPSFPIPESSGCATEDDYFVKVVRERFEMRKSTVLNAMLARERSNIRLKTTTNGSI